MSPNNVVSKKNKNKTKQQKNVIPTLLILALYLELIVFARL